MTGRGAFSGARASEIVRKSPSRFVDRKSRPSRRPFGPPQGEVFILNQYSRPHAEEAAAAAVSKHQAGPRYIHNLSGQLFCGTEHRKGWARRPPSAPHAGVAPGAPPTPPPPTHFY